MESQRVLSEKGSTEKAVRVVLADHQVLVRAGLRILLEHLGAQVVAEASDGHGTVDLVMQHKPDLALIEAQLPRLNGVDATAAVRRNGDGTRVMLLAGQADRRLLTAAIDAGASAFVLKDDTPDTLGKAMAAVTKGEVYLSPRLAGQYVRGQPAGPADGDGGVFAVLTMREREVLQLLAEGHMSKDIARLLHVSVRTVETHRGQISAKTGIRSIARLTKYAIREGLTTLDDHGNGD